MNPARTDDIGDYLWRAFAAAILAIALHAVDGNAFQARGGPGLHGVFSALLSPTPGAREHFGFSARDGEFALQLIDFDLGGREAGLCVGAGWFASFAPTLQYFTAMGVRLPDADAPMPLDADAAQEVDSTLAVGSWAATGLGWRPAQSLRLSIEARWNAENLNLPGEDPARCPFQAGLSVAMNW